MAAAAKYVACHRNGHHLVYMDIIARVMFDECLSSSTHANSSECSDLNGPFQNPFMAMHYQGSVSLRLGFTGAVP